MVIVVVVNESLDSKEKVRAVFLRLDVNALGISRESLTSENLVRILRQFSFIVSVGYQHHRIPDGLLNVRRKMSPKVLNAPMPEVWTHDNLSRHYMPRSNTLFQLFILLCNIVSFMFLFN